jgi:hypothetical protein
VCCIDKDAGVLRRDNGFDDVGDIVYIGEGFDAEEHVVERLLRRMGGVFWGSDNRIWLEPFIAVQGGLERDAVLGDALEAVLPNEGDVAGIGSLEAPRKEGGGAIASH